MRILQRPIRDRLPRPGGHPTEAATRSESPRALRAPGVRAALPLQRMPIKTCRMNEDREVSEGQGQVSLVWVSYLEGTAQAKAPRCELEEKRPDRWTGGGPTALRWVTG